MRSLFLVSDRTGITAENLGKGLLSQFQDTQWQWIALPFIDSLEKICDVVETINETAREDGLRPLVLSTLVNDELRSALKQAEACVLDLFEAYLNPISALLDQKPTQRLGHAHGRDDALMYQARIDALDYALKFDDGARVSQLDLTDVILMGVSRVGKTPICLYLAMQYGIHAANYPLTPEDLELGELPSVLRQFKGRLYGLNISPERLHLIRTERRPNSEYSSLHSCTVEPNAALRMFREYGISYLDTGEASIEELAVQILQLSGLKRRL